MISWRYWITYEGEVKADDEDEAYKQAMSAHTLRQIESGVYVPTIEVEEIGGVPQT